jgi:hypothetical protein
MKIGTLVTYRTGAGKKKQGAVDKISNRSGVRLFRVNDRWFPREELELV